MSMIEFQHKNYYKALFYKQFNDIKAFKENYYMMKKTLAALAMSSLALPAIALDPVADSAGWSGAVDLGAGVGSIETNFMAETWGFDLGNDKIGSFDSPDDEDISLPVGGLKIGYTLQNKKTMFVAGSEMLDALAGEFAFTLGVRHDFGNIGTMQIVGITTAGASTKTWADPYQVDTKRGDTDADSGGAIFTWDKILGSQFELEATVRDRNVDDEDSGISLGLTKAERDLLDRNGDVNRVEVGYTFALEGGKHALRPFAAYVDYDLDGDAMAQDGFELGLGYNYTTNSMVWKNEIAYTSLDGDKDNPIFGDANDADRYSIRSHLMFPGAFGWEKWMPTVGVMYTDLDSDVDFNDASMWLVSASLMRHF
jgi:hypothetical protein